MGNAPTGGAVFFAILPLHSRVTSAQDPGPVFALSPTAPRVLAIEDDPRDQVWLRRTLGQAGYAVEIVPTGTAAINRSRTQAFDAITLDLLLPDAFGRDVLTRIRSEGLNRETPVIIVTVLAATDAGVGTEDVLVKPLESKQLLDALRRLGVAPGEHAGEHVVGEG